MRNFLMFAMCVVLMFGVFAIVQLLPPLSEMIRLK